MKIFALFISLFTFGHLFGQDWPSQKGKLKLGTIDTIRVIMLVSDTSKMGNAPTYSIFGYEVLIVKPYVNDPGTYCVNCGPYWGHLQYLDNRGNMLSEKLIVWQKLNR